MAHIQIHAPLCIAAGALLPPICTGLVVLRFYARRRKANAIEIDDLLTIPALVCLLLSGHWRRADLMVIVTRHRDEWCPS